MVEVAESAVPPVCRIIDFSKFKYDQEKKEREAKKHQKQTKLKEIRLKPNIDALAKAPPTKRSNTPKRSFEWV